MAQIVSLDENVFVSGQINPHDIEDLAARGIRLIVNNRPDGEDPNAQPAAADLEKEARRHGMDFVNIQFASSAVAPGHTAALAKILETASGPMLIFCRSGARSTTLWAAANVALGKPLGETLEKAARAGYDLGRAAPIIEQLGHAARDGS